MQKTTLPGTTEAFASLLKADFTTQWRNRRAVLMIFLVPVLILISWKGLVAKFGGVFALSNCITIGLIAIGLMGYSNSVARDREKGIFQRLRVAPVPAWCIMASRLVVQMAMILILTAIIFFSGYYFDKISLSPAGYVMGSVAALAGGAVYLGLGQAVVGRIKNPETVNATVRLIYFIFIMIGMFAELGALGPEIGNMAKWSPYGSVKHLLADCMNLNNWQLQSLWALLVTIGYGVIFSILGIKWFKWNTR